MTKLYIVEGLPCSGKSTASKYAADLISKSGKNVCFFDEGSGRHPADYEFHAYIKHEQLKNFEDTLQSKIRKYSEENKDGYIAALSEFTDRELELLLPYKIYDFLPWKIEEELMLGHWQQFVEKAMMEECVYVFNSVFLQNPMCETMMRFNFPKKQSFEYIEKIYKMINPLEPMIVYLKNDDVMERIKETEKEREGWLEAVIDYHVNGGYGQSIAAHGFEGYVSCLEERQKRELEFLQNSKIHSIIIENAHRNWKLAYDMIAGNIL